MPSTPGSYGRALHYSIMNFFLPLLIESADEMAVRSHLMVKSLMMNHIMDQIRQVIVRLLELSPDQLTMWVGNQCMAGGVLELKEG